jgi:glycosidase
VSRKVVVYQLVVRTFSNTNETRKNDGTIEENGCGTFDDIDATCLRAIADLGVTHLWLTGVLRQATLTDYTHLGMPPDDGDVVKGRAGSFYAVRDYYDVCPDYARDPARRLEAFDALVRRIHHAGMKVVIDLVPNHVARGYGSVVRPEADFGKGDDTRLFFGPRNDFFYLAEPPGQALVLARPPHWNPEGVAFDGAFAREDGREGRTPKATGNDVTSPSPDVTDWYETVKLNWGHCFADPRASRYEPRPPVWDKMDAILAYWQERGVDGFRADFAHWVPAVAWRWLIARVKERDPAAYVFAEAYADYDALLGAGFDAVYHDAAYDLLKRIYQGTASADDLDALLKSIGDDTRGRRLHYLENHDERRIASPLDASSGPDQSGFGSMEAGRHLAPLLYLYSAGPILVYAGQEVGEPGAGAWGFSGDDGRTSIFDYGSMPSMVRWVNDHAYDGGRLDDAEKSLRAWYADVLRLAQDPAARGDRFWSLRYVNRSSAHPDASDAIYSFARFASRGGRVMVVASNLGPPSRDGSRGSGSRASGKLRVPAELLDAAGLGGGAVTVRLVLDGRGNADETAAIATPDALARDGFDVVVEGQRTNVYLLG